MIPRVSSETSFFVFVSVIRARTRDTRHGHELQDIPAQIFILYKIF